MITGIILAAGQSSRLNSNIPKPFIKINDKRIIDYSIQTFENNVNEIVIVVPSKWQKNIQNEYPDHNVIIGGTTRKESSYRGLIACNKNTSKVLIHDAARPFVSNQIIIDCINMLDNYDAITTAIKPVDTVVTMNGDIVNDVLLRKLCRLEQTPQAFQYNIILEAHRLENNDATDDIYLAHNQGVRCGIVDGCYSNFKITNKIDLEIANTILRNKQK